jgi:CheY-like chemotaxis protein
MIMENFPIKKDDIRYDPSSQEVTLKREKFDAFVKYVRELEEKLEASEDARDVANYRARKAENTSDVFQALNEDVLEGTTAVREWLGSSRHTIRELSLRTKIPYATCHRIVNERLGTPNVEIGHLRKMISVVGKDQANEPRAGRRTPFQRVLLGLPEGTAQDDLVSSWRIGGREVTTVHAGTEVAQKLGELSPDLILVDVKMPELSGRDLLELKRFAQNAKGTMVLTGEIAKMSAALLKRINKYKPRVHRVTGKNVGG